MKSRYSFRKSKRLTKKFMIHLILIIWALFTLTPIFWMILSSLKTPTDVFKIPPKLIFKPTLHNFEVLLGIKVGDEFEGVSESDYRRVRSKFPLYFMNSIIISITSALLAVSLGSLAAYGLTRFRFRGSNSLLIAILLTKVIPPMAIIIPVYTIIRQLRLIDTRFALVMTYLTFNLPFVIWMMRSFFMELPRELEEAALIDGCSLFGAFIKVILPLAAPGLVASTIFCIVLSWNEFVFAIVLTGENAKTLAPTIAGFLTDKAILWGRLFAGGTVVILPVIIFALLIHKKLARGLTLGAIKG